MGERDVKRMINRFLIAAIITVFVTNVAGMIINAKVNQVKIQENCERIAEQKKEMKTFVLRSENDAAHAVIMQQVLRNDERNGKRFSELQEQINTRLDKMNENLLKISLNKNSK